MLVLIDLLADVTFGKSYPPFLVFCWWFCLNVGQYLKRLLILHFYEIVLDILLTRKVKFITNQFRRNTDLHSISIIQIVKLQQYNLMSASKDNLKPYLPTKSQKQRYYTAEEVSHHNTANDCWIVLFGEVYNLTRIIQQNISNASTTPLIEASGTDVTYWFDTSSREPRVKVNMTTQERQFYCPTGKYLHVDSNSEVKWWKDSKNIIGKLTKKARRIRIINMINDHCTILQVPSQETIQQILNRYLKYNKHGASYIWKRLGRPLDMQKTLEENGIEDEDPEFDRLDVIHANWYIPALHLFFSDDLTVA